VELVADEIGVEANDETKEDVDVVDLELVAVLEAMEDEALNLCETLEASGSVGTLVEPLAARGAVVPLYRPGNASSTRIWRAAQSMGSDRSISAGKGAVAGMQQ
jgi:hypothetical protein